MANPPYYEWENFKLKATTAAEFENALTDYDLTTNATFEDQDLTVVYTGPSWTQTTTQKGFKVTTAGDLMPPMPPKRWKSQHIKGLVGLKLYEVNNQTSKYTLVTSSIKSHSNTTGSSIMFRIDDDGNGRGNVAYTPVEGAFDISVTIENHGSNFESYSANYSDHMIYFYGEGGSSSTSTVTESITYTIRYSTRIPFFQQNKTYLLAGAELVTTHNGYYTEYNVDFLQGSPTVHISTSKIPTNFSIYPTLEDWQRPAQDKYSYPFFGVKQKGLAGYRRHDETASYPDSKLFTSSRVVDPFTNPKAPLQFGYTNHWAYNDWAQVDPLDTDLIVHRDPDGSLYINGRCYGRWLNKHIYIVRWDNTMSLTAEQHLVLGYSGRTAGENEVINEGIWSNNETQWYTTKRHFSFSINPSESIQLNYQLAALSQPQQWELFPSSTNLTFRTWVVQEMLSPVINTYISNGYLKGSSKSLYSYEDQKQTLTYNPVAPTWTDKVVIPAHADAEQNTCQATWGSSSGAKWSHGINCNITFKNVPLLADTSQVAPIKLTNDDKVSDFSVKPSLTSTSTGGYSTYTSYTNFKLGHQISYQSLYNLPNINILQDDSSIYSGQSQGPMWIQTWFRNWEIHCYLPSVRLAGRFLYAIYISD